MVVVQSGRRDLGDAGERVRDGPARTAGDVKTLALLLCAWVLAGCGPSKRLYWSKAGFSVEQFRRDEYECLRDTRMAFQGVTVNVGAPPSGLAAVLERERAADARQSFYMLCMEARGYRGEYRTDQPPPAPSCPPGYYRSQRSGTCQKE